MARADRARGRLLSGLRLEHRAGGNARPQRIGDLGQLVDRRSQAEQDRARRDRDRPGDNHRIAKVEFVDRNPETDRGDARPGEQETQYKQDHRHTGTPGPPGFPNSSFQLLWLPNNFAPLRQQSQ
ncbi:MAG TPA: hypothetical protein VGN55_13865 [Xanthobacteraceae bacterium]